MPQSFAGSSLRFRPGTEHAAWGFSRRDPLAAFLCWVSTQPACRAGAVGGSPRFEEADLPRSSLGRLLAALGAALVWLLVPKAGSDGPPIPGSTGSCETIAVLPFEVRGSAELSYLGEGIMDLVNTKLSGVGAIQAVDQRLVISPPSQHRRPPPGTGARLPAQAPDFPRRTVTPWETIGILLSRVSVMPKAESLPDSEKNPAFDPPLAPRGMNPSRNPVRMTTSETRRVPRFES
jgi:hypothetical protein